MVSLFIDDFRAILLDLLNYSYLQDNGYKTPYADDNINCLYHNEHNKPQRFFCATNIDGVNFWCAAHNDYLKEKEEFLRTKEYKYCKDIKNFICPSKNSDTINIIIPTIRAIYINNISDVLKYWYSVVIAFIQNSHSVMQYNYTYSHTNLFGRQIRTIQEGVKLIVCYHLHYAIKKEYYKNTILEYMEDQDIYKAITEFSHIEKDEFIKIANMIDKYKVR